MNAVSAGSLPGNCLNTFTNTGIRNATSASSTLSANDDHERRVDHRRAHLAPQRRVLLELVGGPDQALLEHAAGLARPAPSRRTAARTPSDGARARRTAAARPRRPGAPPRASLAAASTSVCSSSTYSARRIVMPEVTIVASWREATARSFGLTRAKSSTLSSFERYLCAMSTTIRPRSLSCSATSCLDCASTSPRGRDAGEIHRLEDECGHRAAQSPPHAAICSAGDEPPSSRRSSSAECARDSASWRVIFPARTSWASEASIVCMPCAPPVWSTE